MKKLPPLYEEIPMFFELQAFLQETLFPLGFEEHEENISWIKSTEFSRGEFLVRLSTHIADGDYYLTAKSMAKSAAGDKDINDFLVEGYKTKANEFKTKAIAKLNEWLEDKKIQ